jgi:hypothetical protein
MLANDRMEPTPYSRRSSKCSPKYWAEREENMRPAEFEEKDFEGPLYSQLLSGSRNFATPGQVFEGRFGVDAVLEVLNPVFWTLFSYAVPPGGLVLNDYKWGFIWRGPGKKRTLPNFSVNALIQAKRPDVLEGRRSAFAGLGISARYWRFFVTAYQQQILDRVSRVLGNRALIVYASPAFDTFDELYSLTTSGQVVNTSSFIKVQKMSGHKSWNYNVPGTEGIAESEPEFVDDEDFYAEVSRVAKAQDSNADPREELKKLHETILSICKEESHENPLARFFLKRYQTMHESISKTKTKDPELLVYFLGVILFCDSSNIMWFSMGPDHTEQMPNQAVHRISDKSGSR